MGCIGPCGGDSCCGKQFRIQGKPQTLHPKYRVPYTLNITELYESHRLAAETAYGCPLVCDPVKEKTCYPISFPPEGAMAEVGFQSWVRGCAILLRDLGCCLLGESSPNQTPEISAPKPYTLQPSPLHRRWLCCSRCGRLRVEACQKNALHPKPSAPNSLIILSRSLTGQYREAHDATNG